MLDIAAEASSLECGTAESREAGPCAIPAVCEVRKRTEGVSVAVVDGGASESRAPPIEKAKEDVSGTSASCLSFSPPSGDASTSSWQWQGCSAETEVVVLGPGSVLLKQALTEEAQRWMAEYAFAAGSRQKGRGWYTAEGALNATKSRGRLYDAIRYYPEPERILKLCLGLVGEARSAQPKLPQMTPTHMLLLLYRDAEGMGWHRDSDPNDGDNDEPIVSVSLGNACEFGYKPLLQPEKRVRLDSGDVLIWGGPQRMLEHCVESVHPNSCPAHLWDVLDDARVNFTFRSAPNLLGKEEDFGTDTFWVDPS